MELITYEEVERMTGASAATIRRWVSLGLFPAPMKLAGQRMTRWERPVIQHWLSEQAHGVQSETEEGTDE
jgi:predicted DNA-binding transcriptional regulator AlpA